MNIKKLLVKDKGFTLVELMVVVAIIGILAATAIPSFKKYQARSKTAEATLALSQLYTAELTMKLTYESFLTCVFKLGVAPSPKGYYITGFKNSVNVAKTSSNMISTVANCDSTATAAIPASGIVPSATDSFTTPTLLMQVGTVAVVDNDLSDSAIDIVTTSATSFTAESAGSISATALIDKWTINESKELVNKAQGY